MTAIIASGKLIRPKIQNIKQEYFDDLDVSESSLKFIREAMYSVVNEYKGTAFSSRLASKYKLVGKTGTSQVRKITISERESGVLKNEEIAYKLRDHSIFTGFAPYKNPKYAITVVAEHMGSGSKIAAPIAKKNNRILIKKVFKNLNMNELIFKIKKLNWLFISLVSFLTFIGMVMIFSATSATEINIFYSHLAKFS